MNATQLSPPKRKLHLKVVKNNIKTIEDPIRVYINTLIPDFTYNNEKGELVTKNNCILL